MKNYFESDEILSMLWKWRKALMVVFGAAFVVSAIVSSPIIMKPKFKSFSQGYPVNLQKYSDESSTEQMLQILESDAIRDSICKMYNLAGQYEIEADEPHFKNLLYLEYSENIQLKKTKNEAVEITVLNYSPDTAYMIANSLIDLFNIEVKRLQDQNLIEAVKTTKELMKAKKKEKEALEAGILKIRKEYGILDYGSQVKNLSREYYRLLARGSSNQDKIKKVSQELENLKEKGVEYESLSGKLWSARDSYNSLKLKFEMQSKELKREKKYYIDVVRPYVADKKTYPVRWLIVVMSVAISMIGAFGVISFIDRANRKIA